MKKTYNILIKILSVSIVVLLSLLFILNNKTILSNAATSNDVDDDSGKTESTNIDYNLLSLENEKEYINEENFSGLIEEKLNSVGTSVISELKKQKIDYEELLDTADTQVEKEKILSLISTTEELIYDYQQSSSGIQLYSDDEFHKQNVSAAIAFFKANGYKLSAELLTHARNNINSDSNYYPVYGSEVMSSQVTYDCLTSSEIRGTGTFSKETEHSSYETDLYYAIHEFYYIKYTRNTINYIQIYDVYDFEKGKFSGLLEYLVRLIYDAQEAGIITPFNVKIELNVEDYVRMTILEKNDKVWTIRLTNYSNKDIDALYNSKMCDKEDAYDWIKLYDLKNVKIPAKGYVDVKIEENSLAGYIAMCYINYDDMFRYISYAHGLSTKGTIDLEGHRHNIGYDPEIMLMGKNNGNWVVRVFNPYHCLSTVTYNTKMCYENDAKNWTGLKHLSTFNLGDKESKFIEISRNGDASHLAIRIAGDTKEMIIYATGMDKMCNMRWDKINFVHYKYLQITNSGKSNGMWQINVKNPLSTEVTVCYNKKMCNEGDAREWKGLKDENYITLDPNQTKPFYINTNWFATSVAFSYIAEDGARVITYANGLGTDGSINVMTNFIK